MTPQRRRKCCSCGQLYEPDPRNRRHQRHCSQPACRQASKAASQRRWRTSPKGRDYFCGSANRLRVQVWRKAHPGYWQGQRRKPGALQDHCLPQTLVPPADKPPLNPRALQEVIITQGLTLLGLRLVRTAWERFHEQQECADSGRRAHRGHRSIRGHQPQLCGAKRRNRAVLGTKQLERAR